MRKMAKKNKRQHKSFHSFKWNCVFFFCFSQKKMVFLNILAKFVLKIKQTVL